MPEFQLEQEVYLIPTCAYSAAPLMTDLAWGVVKVIRVINDELFYDVDIQHVATQGFWWPYPDVNCYPERLLAIRDHERLPDLLKDIVYYSFNVDRPPSFPETWWTE